MTVLFWILAISSLPVGCFVGYMCFLSHGLGFSYTAFGAVASILGMLAPGVCVAGMVSGIISLRKGNAKRAVLFALIGAVYCAVIIGGVFVDDAIYAKSLEKSVENRNDEIYGEGWDSPPDIEGIPEHYQELLNQYYVMVNEKWPAERLTDIGAVAMADYYGDNAAENIGFTLTDLNGDGVHEMVIGAATSEGTAVFCVYSDPDNPFYYISSTEGDVYYLHYIEAEGAYTAEIVGRDTGWLIVPAEEENTFDFIAYEGPLSPEERITLELTPFSQYK